jgi:hypothetical protein
MIERTGNKFHKNEVIACFRLRWTPITNHIRFKNTLEVQIELKKKASVRAPFFPFYMSTRFLPNVVTRATVADKSIAINGGKNSSGTLKR